MREVDLDAVVQIAAIGFPDHFEGRPCFASRLSVVAEGCFVLADGAGVHGYAFAYPWIYAAMPVLNTVIDAVPQDASVLYLHDLALHPRARGQGHSRTIVECFVVQARDGGLTSVALVAVNDAEAFWASHGFVAHRTPELSLKLASYGPDAVYMIRPLTTG